MKFFVYRHYRTLFHVIKRTPVVAIHVFLALLPWFVINFLSKYRQGLVFYRVLVYYIYYTDKRVYA